MPIGKAGVHLPDISDLFPDRAAAQTPTSTAKEQPPASHDLNEVSELQGITAGGAHVLAIRFESCNQRCLAPEKSSQSRV